MGGRKRKKGKHIKVPVVEDEKHKAAPKSFVIRRGKVGAAVRELVHDMRQLMQPYTALRLQESKKNNLKDFLNVAPTLNVTHFLVFSQTQVGTNMRLVRVPRGPTLTFRVASFSLIRDVLSSQRNPHSLGKELLNPPLCILNNFSGNEDHKQLMAAMFRALFPTIDVQTVQLGDCRRAVLLHMDPDTGDVHLRHYRVNASPVGVTKTVKKIIQAKLPNLNRLNDMSEYVLRGAEANMSDSEAEDTPETRVVLAEKFGGRGNKARHQSAIRLKEIGPRLRLQLLKIEKDFCGGQVLYHSYVTKTKAQAKELKARVHKAEQDKETRRREQEQNVLRKQERKIALQKHQKKKNAERKRQQLAAAAAASAGGDGDAADKSDDGSDDYQYADDKVDEGDSEKDDAQWYREQVGEEPPAQLFDETEKPKRPKRLAAAAPAKKGSKLAGKRKREGDGDDQRKPKKKKTKSKKPTGKKHTGKKSQSKKGGKGRKRS